MLGVVSSVLVDSVCCDGHTSGLLDCVVWCGHFFFFQAEDGIRDLVRSRGLGDVYKRQVKKGGFTEVCRARDRETLRNLVEEGDLPGALWKLSLIHI